MGFYEEWILPALIDLSMRNKRLRPYRERVVNASFRVCYPRPRAGDPPSGPQLSKFWSPDATAPQKILLETRTTPPQTAAGTKCDLATEFATERRGTKGERNGCRRSDTEEVPINRGFPVGVGTSRDGKRSN